MTRPRTALLEKMLGGDRRALSQLLTQLEREPDAVPSIMASVHPHTGSGMVIGVTGPPGAGKSTLIDGMVKETRARGESAGVIAVDPTSAFSGGAVLGDRIRLSSHHSDSGVFVRSLSTSGSSGGLSRIARASVRLLDAFGFDRIFLESVGVGQSEIDVSLASDSVVVVLVPEAGDSIQMMKAGLVEIGDVIAVNKSDRDGANRLATAVRSEVRNYARKRRWSPPVLLTRADTQEGIAVLLDAVDEHLSHLADSNDLEDRRARCRKAELDDAISEMLNRVVSPIDPQSLLGNAFSEVLSGKIDPYSAVALAFSDRSASHRLSSSMVQAAKSILRPED